MANKRRMILRNWGDPRNDQNFSIVFPPISLFARTVRVSFQRPNGALVSSTHWLGLLDFYVSTPEILRHIFPAPTMTFQSQLSFFNKDYITDGDVIYFSYKGWLAVGCLLQRQIRVLDSKVVTARRGREVGDCGVLAKFFEHVCLPRIAQQSFNDDEFVFLKLKHLCFQSPNIVLITLDVANTDLYRLRVKHSPVFTTYGPADGGRGAVAVEQMPMYAPETSVRPDSLQDGPDSGRRQGDSLVRGKRGGGQIRVSRVGPPP